MRNPLLVARSLHVRSLRRAALALGLCAAAAGTLAVSAPVQASPAQFVGIWNNIDPNTRGIVRILVSGSPGALSVRVYGACSPSPCDWNLAPLTTYGSNVSDPDHKCGTAGYNQGFVLRTMTFELVDPTTMVVHTYSKFAPGDGRQNYHTREVFRKLIPIVRPPMAISPWLAPGVTVELNPQPLPPKAD